MKLKEIARADLSLPEKVSNSWPRSTTLHTSFSGRGIDAEVSLVIEAVEVYDSFGRCEPLAFTREASSHGV